MPAALAFLIDVLVEQGRSTEPTSCSRSAASGPSFPASARGNGLTSPARGCGCANDAPSKLSPPWRGPAPTAPPAGSSHRLTRGGRWRPRPHCSSVIASARVSSRGPTSPPPSAGAVAGGSGSHCKRARSPTTIQSRRCVRRSSCSSPPARGSSSPAPRQLLVPRSAAPGNVAQPASTSGHRSTPPSDAADGARRTRS